MILQPGFCDFIKCTFEGSDRKEAVRSEEQREESFVESKKITKEMINCRL